MDVAADRLGRDPVDLRRQNLLAHGEEFAPGDTPVDGKLEESLGRLAEAIQWSAAAAPGRAKGIAAMMKASVAPSVSEAIVRLHADGSANVLVSTVEMGQGARTVMAQIAAEVLALPMDRIRVVPPDTSITPYDQTSSSSRSTTMVGRAVQEAAQDVVDQLRKIAAEMLGEPAALLSVLEGAVVSGAQRLAYPDPARPTTSACVAASSSGAAWWRRGAPRLPWAAARRSGRWPWAAPRSPWTRRRAPSRSRPTRRSAMSAAASTPSSARPRTRARSCRASATPCSRRWCTRAASS
jgi:Aerobic-type carbon monoxide dehydrogenase, large subunit CoxL/CutL homologs